MTRALRKVVMISDPRCPTLRGHGKMLKLECGHEQWQAGFVDDRPGRHVQPCLEGPCYQPDIAMGDSHG